MDCPRCQYHSPFAQTRCPSCFSTFETAALEELGHLQYLRERLRAWRATGVLTPGGVGTALEATEERIAAVEVSLGLRVPPAPRPQPTRPTPSAPRPAAEDRLATVPPPIVATSPQPTPPPALDVPVAPMVPPVVREAASLAPARRSGSPRQQAPAPVPTPAPAPAHASRPAFSWGDVGRYLLSERTLNGLLSLGAFLILTSGTVISIFNPTRLEARWHFASTVITALLFYLAGIFVRLKLRVPRTGAVLLAIGAGFIPLTIWTLGQRALLDLDRDAIWLISALVCFPLFLGSHLLLRDRTFALLTALAGGAEVFTVLNWLGVPLEWCCCALLLLTMRYLALGGRLRDRWPALAWAFGWTAQVATPAILIATLIGRWQPVIWVPLTGEVPEAFFGLAVALAWWLGVAYYVLAARRQVGRFAAIIAAWAVPVALLLTLAEASVARFWHPAAIGRDWHNLFLALLAIGALAWGRWRQRALAGEARPSLRAVIALPVYQLALGLPVVAALWPEQSPESRVPTLFVLVGVYALAAWLFRQVALRAVAAYLLPVAVGFALDLTVREAALDRFYDWHGVAWVLLAAGYLLFARFVLRAGRAADGSYRYLRLALEPVAHTILPLTLMAIAASRPVTLGQCATLVALALLYGAATFLLRQRAWAWPAVIFLPLAALAAFDLRGLLPDERPLGWVAFAVGLLVAAEVAAWRTGESRRALLETVTGLGRWRSRFAAPLFAVGYAVGAAALLGAIGRIDADRYAGFLGGFFLPIPVLATFLIVVAALVASTVTRRASRFLYAACALFPLPYAAACAWIARDQGIFLVDHEAARLFALLGATYLAAALATDRAGVRFAAPLWLAGYGLVGTMPVAAMNDATATVQTLGLTIVLLAASAWLAHGERHPAFLAVVRALAPDPETVEHRTIRALFLYGVAWLFPIWLLFAISLQEPGPKAAVYGLALALLAPVYTALGAWFGRIRSAYRWPWYLCGYLLSAIGPVFALPNLTLASVALAVSIGLWIISAVASRRAGWLYPVALCIPILVLEVCARLEVSTDLAGLVPVVLSLGYTAAGMVLHRGWRRPVGAVRELPGRFARPFFGVGQLLVLVGLALAVFAPRELNVITYALAALGYTALAWLFGQPAFAWPATATATIAYAIGMSLAQRSFPFTNNHYGLALLPLLFTALIVADTLRRLLDDTAPERGSPRGIAGALLALATPCYALAYGGTPLVLVFSSAQAGVLALAWWGVAALYALSTALFRHPASLYPALGAALAGSVATANVLFPGLSDARLLALLIVPAWLLAVVADAIATLRGGEGADVEGRWPFLGADRLLAEAWAAPPLAFALGALLLATVGSAPEAEAGLVAALAGCALLGLAATRWRGEGEAWGAVALAGLAFWQLLRLVGVPEAGQATPWALLALALTVLGIGVRTLGARVLDPWRRPLAYGAMGYSAWALLLGATGAIDANGGQSFAFTLALTGLSLIAHGFDRRERLLSYAGVACLEAGYMVHLFVHEIGQPQAFALPAGLYLLGIAYLEWRRGTGAGIKAALEVAALSILISVSAIQALGYLGELLGERYSREFFGSFMLIETAALFALGAALRWRRTFFGGAFGVVLAVVILLKDPFQSLNAWYIAAIIGFAMIALVIFIEQRRQQIPVWIGEWRARLEEWD